MSEKDMKFGFEVDHPLQLHALPTQLMPKCLPKLDLDVEGQYVVLYIR